MRYGVNGKKDWEDLTTLDIEPSHWPDVVQDLDLLPYPFEDGEFDEIHAYEVLEHCGRQGDWRFFFAQWAEFHRILKPDGYFVGSVPLPTSIWAWGDPSHTRVIPLVQLEFLSQKHYDQVGTTTSSDFRSHWKHDFAIVHAETTPDLQVFVLRKQ
jgi:SAM-dependent methyltransferase